MKRELAVQGLLLLVLLAVLFPRVFFAGEYAVASALMGQWAPWDAVFGAEMRPHQNPLAIETVMAFHADYALVKQQLGDGQWPLWNSLQFAGKPLLANYQSTVVYPPRLLHAVLPIPLATTLYVLLKLWICGMTAFGYGRVIGLGVAASRFLSAAWMMGGYAFTWAYWTPTDVAAWFPLVMIGVELLLRGSTRRGFSTLLIGATLMLLAGHPESAFVNGVGAGLYFLLRLAMSRASAGRSSVAGTVALVAWGVALLICAVQIIPFGEYAAHSNNVAFRDSSSEARHAVPLNDWVSFFVPRYFGTNAEGNFRGSINSTFNSMMYPGIAVWIAILSLLGSWRTADRQRVGGWLFTSASAALFAFDLAFVQSVLDFPLFSSLWQCYFLSFALFGAIVLAAMGLDAWCGRIQKLNALYPSVALTALVVLVMIPKAAFDLSLVGSDGGAAYLTRQLGIAALLAGLCLSVQYAGVRWKSARFVPLAFTILLAVDLTVAGRGLLPTTPREHHFPETDLTSHLRNLPDGSRIDVVSETDILPGLMTPYAVEEHWGYDGILPARIIAFHAHLGDPEKAHLLSGVTHRLVKQEAEEEGEFATLSVVRNADALPRAFVAHDWIIEPGFDAVIARLTGESIDTTRAVVLERRVSFDPGGENAPLLTPAEIVSRGATRVVIRAATERPAVLVLLDAYYPGWSASVDGENTAIVPVNHAFRGVALPAGKHEVEFRYRPRSFAFGLWISIVSLGTAFMVGFVCLRFAR